jgi:hypothetical protein
MIVKIFLPKNWTEKCYFDSELQPSWQKKNDVALAFTPILWPKIGEIAEKTFIRTFVLKEKAIFCRTLVKIAE